MNSQKNELIRKSFEEIGARSISQWKALKTGEEPVIYIGTATCGRAAGALKSLKVFEEELSRQEIKAKLVQVGCLGHCYAEPLVIIDNIEGYPPILYGNVTPGVASLLVKSFIAGDDPCFEYILGALEENELIPTLLELPRFQGEKRVLLKNCGRVDPGQIGHYIARGGYQALVKSLNNEPEKIIAEIKDSGLRGRGGAGYPAGRKWKACRKASGSPKYVICNADEGDPGAFMDRTILESDPHQVLEGLIIAAYAAGAAEGYIYLRAEYPLAVSTVETALKQAEEWGLLGANILGSDFSFHLKLFQGSGAFVCGEETALIYSLEGKRGMPRYRPPFPAVNGFKGKPTLINNVKTLAAIPSIINKGAKWHSDIGTETSKGTAIFALAGRINNAGLVEVPMGSSLKQVIFEVGGGVAGGKNFKAVQIGGPSGGCLPGELLETPVDFDSLKKTGTIMGSGGMVVMDDNDCMTDVARYFLEFTQYESCGKCTFCRIGTRQMLAILENITRGEGNLKDLDLLEELSCDIRDGSLCALGKTAPNPVLTTLRYFREEYEAHILEKRCPALSCPDLTTYYIVPEKCERSCDACVGSCPVEAIFSGKNRVKIIDQNDCVKCDSCMDACPPEYNAVIKISPLSSVPESEPRPEKDLMSKSG